jgi:hypothetical protein
MFLGEPADTRAVHEHAASFAMKERVGHRHAMTDTFV